MSKGPLTAEECGDSTVIRERFGDVLDRHFMGENTYAATAAWNALEYEVLRPILTRIAALEAQLTKPKLEALKLAAGMAVNDAVFWRERAEQAESALTAKERELLDVDTALYSAINEHAISGVYGEPLPARMLSAFRVFHNTLVSTENALDTKERELAEARERIAELERALRQIRDSGESDCDCKICGICNGVLASVSASTAKEEKNVGVRN